MTSRARHAPVAVAWAEPELQPGLRLSERDEGRDRLFPPARRAAFQTGRALLGQLVAAEGFEVSSWEVTTADCPRCGGPHGPVSVVGAPLVASIGYADGRVVVALGRRDVVAAVGVDVERAPLPSERAADLARLLGGPSRTVLRRWTQVEAVLKADGRGLRVDPATVLIGRGRASVPGGASDFRLAGVSGLRGHVVSLAWRPADPATGTGGGVSAVPPGPASR